MKNGRRNKIENKGLGLKRIEKDTDSFIEE